MTENDLILKIEGLEKLFKKKMLMPVGIKMNLNKLNKN